MPASSAARAPTRCTCVVGVAVAAVGLVVEQHVDVLLAQDRGQPLGGLLDVGADEAGRAGRVGGDLGPEAAVGVAEVLDPGDAEGLGARAQLVHAGRGAARPSAGELAGGQARARRPSPRRRRPGGPPRRRAPSSPRSAGPRRRGVRGRPGACAAQSPILAHGTVSSVKVALLSDCYLPRLGGIEVQTHDLAQHLQAAGHEVEVFTATRGAARRDARDRDRRRRRARAPAGRPDAVGAADQPVRARRAAPAARRGRLRRRARPDRVVSPFAWDSTRVTVGLGLPTAMTWHCMLAGVAPGLSGCPVRAPVGVARRGHVGRVGRRRGAAAPARRARRLGRGAAQRHRRRTVGRGARCAREPGPLRLVTAMRLAPRKRPAALVELVAEAARLAGPASVSLTVLGEGPDRRKVEALVRERRLDWVSLPGPGAARRAARAVCRRRRLPVPGPSRVVRDRSPRGADRRASGHRPIRLGRRRVRDGWRERPCRVERLADVVGDRAAWPRILERSRG